MAFSLRIGPMLVTADTAAEAADLVRALGGLPANEAAPSPEPPSQPAAVDSPTTEAAASSPPAKPQRKWPIGRGAIFRNGNRFALEISIAGKSDRRGTFKTREEAERAQEETYQARLRGDPLPIYVWRRCRRCGVVGHTAIKCKAPAAVEQLDELADDEPAHAPIWPDWSRSSPMMGDGDPAPPAVVIPAPAVAAPAPAAQHHLQDPVAPAAPAPPATVVASAPKTKGTPEWRARVADAVRASWARRRAAREQPVTGDHLPPAVVTAKLPPHCGRCFRVGHVDTECPTAAPASIEVEKQEDGLEAAADDTSDLTDLVDVPDAEPTVIPDINLGIECQACGRRGHIMSSPDCPLTTKPGWSPESARASEPRAPLHFCLEVQRPCPRTRCRFHLGPERPGVPLADLPETCTLDVADRGGITLEEVGVIFDLTRERIRQIETKALKRIASYVRRHRIDFELPVSPRTNAPEDAL